jgi:hypothetical protein
MNIKKSTMAVAVSAVIGLSMAWQAAAYTEAGAKLDINNLLISPDTIIVRNFTFSLINTATLNGSSSPVQSATCFGNPASNTCSGVSPVLDAAAANSPLNSGPGADLVNNSFPLLTDAPAQTDTAQYSRSDSVINTAQLVQGIPTSTQQMAQTQLTDTGSGNANAEIQSITGLTMNFSTGDSNTITISFLADPDMKASSDNPESSFVNAAGSVQTSVKLVEDGTANSATWAPDGLANLNCGLTGAMGCSNETDGESLNTQASISTDPADNRVSVDGANFSNFSITFTSLALNTDHTFTLFAKTSSLVTKIVETPEPGTMLMLGAGLAGLGGMNARRRKKKAAV